MKTLAFLLKREYWEHRGGFLWTPVWITGVMLLFTLLGVITAEVMKGRVQFNVGPSLETLRSSLGAHEIATAANALDLAQLSLAGLVGIGVFFVTFFYLLGALYDDRRDRSVLFWKSLPITDMETVASKALTAMLLIPLIGLAVATLAYVGFVVIIGAWALPTIGWLLFWSAWARSKPFLWAVLLPIVALVLDGWVGLMGAPRLSEFVDLGRVFGRVLFSVMPGGYLSASGLALGGDVSFGIDDEHVAASLGLPKLLAVLSTADLWIGVASGLLLLAAASWLRGRRIETST